GNPKKDSTESLHEARNSQCSHQRQSWRGKRRPRGTIKASEKAQVDEQFADEPIQWWQPTNGNGTQKKQQRRFGHRLSKPSHEVDLARAGRVNGRTSREKQQ